MPNYLARERGRFTGGPAWRGSIVTVYARAVNIRRPDGLLVSLVKDQGQMSALSVHVPELFASPPPTGIAPGRRASWDERRLLLAGRAVVLEGAPWYDGSLRLSRRPDFPEPLRAGLERALLALGKGGGLLGVIAPGGSDNHYVRTAGRILRAAGGGGKAGLKGLDKLVGLGVGFTPSGDDFLAGVLLGEAMAAERASLRLEKREIRAALGKTNDGGRSLLYQVLKGQFPSYLIETAAGLAAARDQDGIVRAVARAVSHGETSGTDTLSGLLWYLTASAAESTDKP
jgi:hypothetical protein